MVCVKCKQGTEFYGSDTTCKKCRRRARRERHAANPEKDCARERARHAANRKTANAERQRRYRSANPVVQRVHGRSEEEKAELLAEARRRWNAAHPELVRAQKRRWAKRHRKEINVRSRQTNRENQRRRRLDRNPEALAYVEILLADPCSYCGEPADTIDHIEALVTGGDNHWTNFTAACRRCNSAKNARPLLVALGGG